MRVLSLCLHPHAEPAQVNNARSTFHRVCYPWGVKYKRVTLTCNKMQRVQLVGDDEASVLYHLTVKACCTAPSLNPNKTTQKNNASPKRPQFFFTGIAESSTASRARVRLEQEVR